MDSCVRTDYRIEPHIIWQEIIIKTFCDGVLSYQLDISCKALIMGSMLCFSIRL